MAASRWRLDSLLLCIVRWPGSVFNQVPVKIQDDGKRIKEREMEQGK